MIHMPLVVDDRPVVIAEVEPMPRHAPIHFLMLAITARCNLRCPYCFVNKTEQTMTSEIARKSVDFFLHRNITGSNQRLFINFFGGEPFMEIGLMEEVIAYTRSVLPGTYKSVSFAATTNGTIANRKVERLIRDSRMELMISLDGDESAMRHRPFVSGRPSYGFVAQNLAKLVSWASRAVVRMTFHPESLEFVKNIQHALDLGAPVIALSPVVESNWQGFEEKLEDAYQDLADWFIEEARNGTILPLEETWTILKLVAQAKLGFQRPERPCDVGKNILGVDPSGNILPCHRFLYRPKDWLGTVNRPQLSSARNHYLDLNSKNLLGCDTCSAKSVCGGGCRVVNLEAGLGLNGTHPGHCLTMRAHARAAFQIYETLMAEQNKPFLQVLRSRNRLEDALVELSGKKEK